VLNIATGGSETVDALADTIGRLLDRPVEKTYGPAQPGDVRESWADVGAAHDAIGYAPSVGFEEGLRRTIEAMATQEGA
jgi:UDP-glucose 4-epimerase